MLAQGAPEVVLHLPQQFSLFAKDFAGGARLVGDQIMQFAVAFLGDGDKTVILVVVGGGLVVSQGAVGVARYFLQQLVAVPVGWSLVVRGLLALSCCTLPIRRPKGS